MVECRLHYTPFSMALIPDKKPDDRAYIMFGLRIVGDFGATIAVPVILFVLMGQWLEEKYGHAPWFTVSAFVLAALLSGVSIYKKAKNYDKKYREIEKNNE